MSFAGDWIRDGAGDDVVYGNQGADQFDVGEGDDTLYGGAEGLTPGALKAWTQLALKAVVTTTK